MYFAPHILFRKTETITTDEFGMPTKSFDGEWEEVCRCRCDDNTMMKLSDENGREYRPSHNIVCEGDLSDFSGGEEIRVTMKDGVTVRAKGTVRSVKRHNWYNNYTILYV